MDQIPRHQLEELLRRVLFLCGQYRTEIARIRSPTASTQASSWTPPEYLSFAELDIILKEEAPSTQAPFAVTTTAATQTSTDSSERRARSAPP